MLGASGSSKTTPVAPTHTRTRSGRHCRFQCVLGADLWLVFFFSEKNDAAAALWSDPAYRQQCRRRWTGEEGYRRAWCRTILRCAFCRKTTPVKTQPPERRVRRRQRRATRRGPGRVSIPTAVHHVFTVNAIVNNSPGPKLYPTSCPCITPGASHVTL